MSMKKKAPPPEPAPPLRRTARAMEHGLEAAGARFVREGFSDTPEGDLRFALGYPHFVELIEGDARDADPARSTAEIWRALLLGDIGPEGDVDRRAWPRGVASNVARILAHPGATFYSPGRQVWGPTPEATKLLERGPVDREEASALLRMALGDSSVGSNALLDLLWVLEALVGPDAVLDDLVDSLEAWDHAAWARADLYAYAAVYALAPLLLRVTTPRAEAHRERLAAVQQHTAGGVPAARDPQEPCRPLHALDVVLHGAAGARRSAMPVATPASVLWELQFVSDDVEYVAGRFCGLKTPGQALPDARLLFLGGARVLDHQLGWWSKYKGGAQAQRTLVRTYGPIRAPQIVLTMVDMLSRSKVKSEVRAWLLAHREAVAPLLADAKGEAADAARALLDSSEAR